MSQAQQKNENMSKETAPTGENPTISQQQKQKDDGDIGLSKKSTQQKKKADYKKPDFFISAIYHLCVSVIKIHHKCVY